MGPVLAFDRLPGQTIRPNSGSIFNMGRGATLLVLVLPALSPKEDRLCTFRLLFAIGLITY